VSVKGWLRAETSPALRWVSVLLSAMLGLRAGLDHGLATALLCGGMAGGYAWALLSRGSVLGDVALAVVPCAIVGRAGVANLNLAGATFWGPFFAQSPGQKLLLGLRGFVVLIALLRLPAGELATRRSLSLLASVAALTALSLFASGALLGSVVASALLLRMDRQPATPRLRVAWLVPAMCAFALWPHREPAPLAVAPPSPAEVIASSIAQENPYRAHRAALAWAKAEPVPGEGYLALARLDHDRGDVIKARKVLGKVLASTASEDIRAQAQALQNRWSSEPP